MRLLVALSLVASLLTGCSGEGDDYCGVLRDERTALAELAQKAQANDADYLTAALAIFQGLRKAAPEDLRDEWDTLIFAWSDLVDALKEAGIAPRDFDPKKRPADVSPTEFSHVRDLAAELSSTRVLDAADGIDDHAEQECNVDLSL